MSRRANAKSAINTVYNLYLWKKKKDNKTFERLKTIGKVVMTFSRQNSNFEIDLLSKHEECIYWDLFDECLRQVVKYQKLSNLTQFSWESNYNPNNWTLDFCFSFMTRGNDSNSYTIPMQLKCTNRSKEERKKADKDL
ncbi:CLUMA_CG002279, isoform A [Clunio marinus]|uniref:CLUMA_CG002279, isoform A n=1 Tax=Clunio marinus TaxID=568069 RepID=A0A1J1HPR9_9DIPT|nr:CLUMA_CG002279, isoform A [Clunio marinus]